MPRRHVSENAHPKRDNVRPVVTGLNHAPKVTISKYLCETDSIYAIYMRYGYERSPLSDDL